MRHEMMSFRFGVTGNCLLSFAPHTAAKGDFSSKALRLPIARNNIITEIAKKLVVNPHAE